MSLPMTTIAKITGISPTSVQRILLDNLKLRTAKHLPVNLCFDEFRSTHGQMSFICIDADTHDMVTMRGDRLTKTLLDFFSNQYTKEEREAVRHITMDMNAAHQTIVPTVFPNAEIVIDRFHIIQLVTSRSGAYST